MPRGPGVPRRREARKSTPDWQAGNLSKSRRMTEIRQTDWVTEKFGTDRDPVDLLPAQFFCLRIFLSQNFAVPQWRLSDSPQLAYRPQVLPEAVSASSPKAAPGAFTPKNEYTALTCVPSPGFSLFPSALPTHTHRTTYSMKSLLVSSLLAAAVATAAATVRAEDAKPAEPAAPAAPAAPATPAANETKVMIGTIPAVMQYDKKTLISSLLDTQSTDSTDSLVDLLIALVSGGDACTIRQVPHHHPK